MNNDPEFLDKIREVILKNISKEKFGVQEIAAEMGVSRSHFFRKVKALTGKSANYLIREVRLEEAVKLLEQGKCTISEISYEVGFSSPSYFNKCFHDRFGITPGHFIRNKELPQEQPKLKSNLYPKLSLVFLVVIFAVFGARYLILSSEKKEQSIQSIAVLPLLDLSEDKNMDYMSIGLMDAITLELSKLKKIRVISRGSAMLFQESDEVYAGIAKKLGVDLLLEGSVMYYADSIRVTVQLISPSPLERHLWAKKYDVKIKDVFFVADEISSAIAEEMNILIGRSNVKSQKTNIDSKAVDNYLKGKYLLQQQNPKSIQRAIEYLQEAILIDSDYAPSYAALANCYISMNKLIRNNEEKLKNRKDCRLAIQNALEKAMELDENLAEVYITKGNIFCKFDWDWEQMKKMAKRGLELNPNHPYGHVLLSNYYLIKGDYSKSIDEIILAEHYDPLNPSICSLVARRYMIAGHYNKAISKFKQVLELFPNYGFAWDGIGFAYFFNGEPEKAKEAWLELHKIMGNHHMADYFAQENFKNSINYWLSKATGGSNLYCSNPSIIAMAHLLVNKKEGALEYLEYAYEYRNEDLPILMMNPIFKNLYDEPRFKAIASKLNVELDY
ncbi:helix-turn-helix domain-containing protein [Marinifilum fragile]|uniref:helix-turn-helix domain-containing protein n=1 Tax=Marinifilum fragile TaxID=570161 RepID=UPI0006D018CD|nr:helix-turn-helix domain-containing protein [Marinifilum fragile]